MFQRGSSPIRLSQLDVAPIVQASQMAEAADVNLSNAVNQSILDFTKKQEQKKKPTKTEHFRTEEGRNLQFGEKYFGEGPLVIVEELSA